MVLSELSTSNLRSGLKQFRKTIDVSGTGITNHEIAKPALNPGFHVERQFSRLGSVVTQPGWQGPFLKHENGNMVFPYIVDEMRTRRLFQIRHPPTQQRKLAILEFRQIERERNLSLEPGLYRVPVGRNHIDRGRTGECLY